MGTPEKRDQHEAAPPLGRQLFLSSQFFHLSRQYSLLLSQCPLVSLYRSAAGVLVEVLAEAGQEGVHQTTTTDSPDPLVEISGLLPLLAPLVSSEDLSPSLQPTLLAVSLEDSLQPLPPSCEPNQPNPAYLYLG